MGNNVLNHQSNFRNNLLFKILWRSPFRCYHYIEFRLIPEIITAFCFSFTLCPRSNDFKIWIEQYEITFWIIVTIAHCRNHDITIGQTMGWMRCRNVVVKQYFSIDYLDYLCALDFVITYNLLLFSLSKFLVFFHLQLYQKRRCYSSSGLEEWAYFVLVFSLHLRTYFLLISDFKLILIPAIWFLTFLFYNNPEDSIDLYLQLERSFKTRFKRTF